VLIKEKDEEIQRIGAENPPQDAVREVFNKLSSFIGLGEYSIDKDRRLMICVGENDQFDISQEGCRISSAQRKILSLCYYFAEIVAQARSPSHLGDYILIFDDPVDSADYIYFHSITAVIERAEKVMSQILGQKVRFGQFIVLTHNSLLYDRLNSPRWRDVTSVLRKENGRTVLRKAEKSINNYAEYVATVCRYYKNPRDQKSHMIYIGNIIRRTLEILASFDSLGSNDFRDMLDGGGKLRLALLANHLSHESFTRVLNPLATPEELQQACRELLELIFDRHPVQFKTIAEKHGICLESADST
jgi:wobble nucleotide-excising tRNase